METVLSKAGVNKLVLPLAVLIVLVLITFAFMFAGNDGVFAPMLMVDMIFVTVWLFKPGKGDSKTGFYAIIAYGALLTVLCIAFSILVPILGPQLGWEAHPDDQNGIMYPAVNDGRENIYFGSFVFVFYYIVSIYQKIAGKRKRV